MARLQAPVTSSDHIAGDRYAPVTLVEYGDYQCWQCRLAHPIIKRVRSHFGRNLRFVFRHFPLSQVHPYAETAAETAEFAAAYGRFWEMHDSIYENQGRLGIPAFFAMAHALRLPDAALLKALQTGAYGEKVRADFFNGVRGGVNGTPTFFIDDLRCDLLLDFHHFAAVIEAALSQTKPGNELIRPVRYRVLAQ